MNLTPLKYYVSVVEHNSFTKAANSLYVSQSAVSKAVKSLEDEWGVMLLQRQGKEVMMTDAGKQVYLYAKDIFSHINAKTDELKRLLAESQPTVKLALPPSVGIIYFSKSLLAFQNKYPTIRLQTVELTSKHLIQSVDEGELDLGVVIEPFDDKRFDKKTVLQSEAVLITSKDHPLAQKKAVPFAALDHLPYLSVSKDYMYYDRSMKLFEQAHVRPNVIFESYQWDLILTLVAENQGVSIMPKPLIEKAMSMNLAQLHLTDPKFPWGLSIIYKRCTRLRPEVQTFLAFHQEERV